MDEKTLYAARDPQGVRPLVLGRLERGWVVASETAALDIVGATFVREIEPGELLTIDERGVRSRGSRWPSPRAACSSTSTSPAPTRRSPDAASRPPASRSAARWPASTRSRPTWSSPRPSRAPPPPIGYAEESGIPYGQGLVKNSYVGRTFIQPSPDHPPARHPAQAQPAERGHRGQAPGRRRRLDRARQHPARDRQDAARGGRREVHVRISSPPVSWPCFYGIDFATQGRADRQQPHRRGDPRLASAPTRSATSRSRA